MGHNHLVQFSNLQRHQVRLVTVQWIQYRYQPLQQLKVCRLRVVTSIKQAIPNNATTSSVQQCSHSSLEFLSEYANCDELQMTSAASDTLNLQI